MSFNDEYQKLRKKRLGVEESVSSDDDIAPVDRKWYQEIFKGSAAFDDGWQVGDITKTMLSSSADLSVNALKGAGRLVEGITDLGGHAIAGVADLFGADEFADDFRDEINKSAVDRMAAPIDDLLDDNSIFGDTGDAIGEGLGQVAAIILTGGAAAGAGATSAGVSALTTGIFGASSMGSGISEAYLGGATDGEAFAYGLLKGGIDAGTELIFGGLGKVVNALGVSRGISSLDDIFAKKLSSKISNQFFKNAVQFGVKSSAEGLEEVLAGFGSAVAKKLTYMSDEELSALVKDENLMEQFAVGAITSGISQSGLVPGTKRGSMIESTKAGRDFITGLTANEQAVFDKVYNDRIAAAEENGEKLTGKDKRKIYDEVMEDLAKGGISIDDIESALGGDTYMEYKNTVYEEDNLQKEFDELGDMKEADFTAKQRDRYNELKQLISESKAKDTRGQLKSKLHENVFSLAKDSAKLSESYLEKDRRSQAYTDDFSAYDEKEKETVQKAIDSGILNNTRRTHEFVRTLAKLAKETGKTFDFTNNAKLKESGFAVDGKTVNGFYTKEGITVNMDSHKAWQSTVGHEITHVLEGTELYGELQKALFEYAKSKNDYQGRYDALKELYKDVEGADIDAELTADLVGDYLFTDSDFVNNLSVTNRNVFQKIYDEIKHLMKLVTAGSKEARQLEKVKRTFDKAYREGGKSENNVNSKTDYSLSEAKVPTREELESKDAMNVVDITASQTQGSFAERRKQILNNLDDVISKPYLNHDTNTMIFLTKKSYTHAFNNLGDIQLNAAEHLPEFIENAVLTHAEKASHGDSHADGVYTFFAAAKQNNQVLPVKLKVKEYTYSGQELPKNIKEFFENNPQGYASSYDTVVLEVEEIEKSPNGSVKDTNQNDSFLDPKELSSISIADLLNLVKGDAEKYIPKSAKNSLSFEGEAPIPRGRFSTPASDLRLDAPMQEDIGPVREDISQTETPATVSKMEQVEDYAPVIDEVENKRGWRDIVKSFAEPTDADFDNGSWSEDYLQYHKNIRDSVEDAVVSEVINDVNSGMSSKELMLKAKRLMQEYESVQANKKSDEAWTEAEILTLSSLYSQSVMYQSVAENPSYVDDLKSALFEKSNATSERFASITDADAPSEVEAPYYGEGESIAPDDPFENRDIKAVGNRKVKAYMYENPEVKPFFQKEANVLLGELYDTQKGERFYTPVEGGVPGTYGAESYGVWSGVSRHTTADIEYLLDAVKMSYADIEKGLKAIIEDNGAENIAAAKKIEFVLNDRLMNGYQDISGYPIPADQDYINLLNEKQIREYSEEARKRLFEDAEAPPVDDIAPVAVTAEIAETPVKEAYEAIKPKQTKEPSMKRIEKPVEDIAPTATYETNKSGQIDGQRTMFPEGKTAKVLTEEPKVDRKSRSAWSMFKNNVLDKGMVFEDLSLETGNRELQARWNSIRYSEGKAQKLIGEGNASVSSLKSIKETVENSGKTEQFYEYLYHMHNVDRMSLEEKAAPTIGALRSKFGDLKIEQVKAIAAKKVTDQTTEKTANTIREAKMYLNALETKNKPVFGDSVTAEVSRETAAKLEKANPEFKEYAKEVYGYMNYLRDMLVDGGVISNDTAKLWAEMYPHYVPIRRQGDTGLNINVPLDTGRTGVNAPIKRATGGNRDILPLFDTMAMRTEQTYKAIAKNRFGVELKNTLGTTIADEATSVDDAIDSIDAQDSLLQEGKNGNNPTFTVFENGKKVTFEITEEMYDALKPTSKELSYTNKVANTIGKVFRGLLTEYNPVFMATNAVKDVQDILINSQHARATYAAIPKAIKEMASNGHWYHEYLANGGEQNTYFDGKTNTFTAEDEGLKKLIGMPLRGISFLNNTIERVPRLAEYIASREAGRSVDVSMLDAARVTTNFAAGGDVTKFLNRNGFNFLNASMQGAMQQARNVREAKANGLKGWVQLASKVALAGIPALILNNLLWDDDEEYAELSDYVKDNYYVVAKFGDGQFVRIPKGRTLAVIQDAMEQVSNALTGDNDVDLQNFLELAISNLAPNNPIENNILAPIMQVKNNETWYGEDLVPTRLQDLPAAEQFDESTDSISKWLGEKLDYSPYKINYLLNQYTGGIGDVVLPMLTPEAESGDNSLVGNILAPWKDKFTTDSVMNNQNVSDFYNTVDELTANAKSSYATDEDVLKYKYMNSVNSDLGELYKLKREFQNSDIDDAKKYEIVRVIQEEINSLARESLNSYNDVYMNGYYAAVGDRIYKLNNKGEWEKMPDKRGEKQRIAVLKKLVDVIFAN